MSLQLPERAALAFVGSVSALHARAIHPFHSPHFLFLFGQWRTCVLVEKSGFGFWDVPVGKAQNGDCLLAPVGPAQPQFVTDPQVAMRFAALAIDLDLSAEACLLCL